MIKHNHQLDKEKRNHIYLLNFAHKGVNFTFITEGRKALDSHNLGAVSQERGCPVGVWNSIFLTLHKLFF